MTGSYITCDHDGCTARVTHFASDSWRIQLVAATEHGWSTGDDGDLCPRHKPQQLPNDELEAA